MRPYKTIWLNPRQTFLEFVVEKEKQPLYALPIVLMGLSFGLDTAPQISALFDEGFVWWSLLVTLPLGIALAFLFLGLALPGLVLLFGRIWNRTTTLRQMVNIYALASFPLTLLLIYQVILFVFGLDPSFDGLNQGLSYILWLWSFALLIIGVAKVQKLSYGMALLNIVLGYLPFFIIALMRY